MLRVIYAVFLQRTKKVESENLRKKWNQIYISKWCLNYMLCGYCLSCWIRLQKKRRGFSIGSPEFWDVIVHEIQSCISYCTQVIIQYISFMCLHSSTKLIRNVKKSDSINVNPINEIQSSPPGSSLVPCAL